MYLTRRQREIFEFIRDFIGRRGYSPSIAEIGERFGLSSPATVHKHLQNLASKGLIRRDWNRSRAIELVEQREEEREVPLLGVIAAGEPITVFEGAESLPIPWRGSAHGVYALRVQGESMVEDGIQDGDYVIIEKRQEPRQGETVVALIEGERATLKRFYREEKRIRLEPRNPEHEPIILEDGELLIQGVVVGLLRRFR